MKIISPLEAVAAEAQALAPALLNTPISHFTILNVTALEVIIGVSLVNTCFNPLLKWMALDVSLTPCNATRDTTIKMNINTTTSRVNLPG